MQRTTKAITRRSSNKQVEATVKVEDYYQKFLDSLSNSPNTQAKYVCDFKAYLRWLDVKDPNQLITPTLLDSPAEIRKVEDQLVKYLKHLHQVEKLSYNTINVRMAAINNFYTINRVHIDRLYISKFKPSNKKIRIGDLPYTTEQINTLIEKANTRDRMVILLLVSTGMRIGALCSLTIGNLHKIYVKGYPNPSHIYKVIVYEGESEQYYTFTTFECAAAIDDYLKEREHFGEQLTNNEPLIRNEFNHSNIQHLQKPEFITTNGMEMLVDRLLLVSRLRVRTKKKDRVLHKTMKSHGFRKFTITQMKKAQLDFSDREFLVGHKHSRGLDVNYDRTSEEDRLQEYLKAIDLLTISHENRLRKQVAEQEYTIQVRLAESEKQRQDLVERIDQLEAFLANPEQYIKMRDEVFKTGEKKKISILEKD